MKTQPQPFHLVTSTTRRRFLGALSIGSAFFTLPGAFAEALVITPAQTEGPYYPDQLPLDTDNDLLVINDGTTPAIGEVTYLSGHVLSASGSPVRNALVEIWQADAHGIYRHTKDTDNHRQEKRDKNFQSFGRFLTGSSGEYLFRTIKPVKYPGRTPHIHFKVKRNSRELLTSQCYIKGEPGNEQDSIYMDIRDPEARAAVTVPFMPMPGAAAGELSAKLDIVLGLTPQV